jgi:hypothetical protein
MKRHQVSFLIAVIFFVSAFIAKYNGVKESIEQSGKWVKVIPGNAYWILFVGGAVFAFLGSREYEAFKKKQAKKDEE